MSDYIACGFCGEPADDTMMSVEMNLHDGEFAAHQNHPEVGHGGGDIDAERVYLSAHLRCYAKWYEGTYKTPFTMSG